MNIGEKLASFRIKSKLSKTELSKKSGVGISTISELENGIRNSINTDNLQKLAEALGVYVVAFFTDESDGNVEIIDINDIEDYIRTILTDDNLTLDDKTLTDNEKYYVEVSFMAICNNIRNKRSFDKEK